MEFSEFLMEMAKAFKSKNPKRMRKINDKILRKLALTFDKDYYELAVISYVLSKILSKPRFFQPKYKGKMAKILDVLLSCAKEKKSCFSELERLITMLEEEDPRFIINLFTKAKLKTAAILYAQGFSLGKASQLTGIPKHEIMAYAGKTMMFDRVKEELPVEKRLKIARKALGV